MHEVMGLGLLIATALTATMTAITAVAWRLEADGRVRRALIRALGGQPDTTVTAPARHQGIAIRLQERRIAIGRGAGDLCLVFDFEELLGVEVIFDGRVAARVHRGEPRRPLDQISPLVRQVSLRLAFDDLADPEFELELLRPEDEGRRGALAPQAAVADARRWFAQLEAVARRAGSMQDDAR